MTKKIIPLLTLMIGLNLSNIKANHIVGGELELVHVNGFTYNINLIVYFDKYQNGQIPPPNPGPEATATVYIYGNSDDQIRDIFTLNLSTNENVSYTNQDCAIGELDTSRPLYTTTVILDPERYSEPEGYYIVWERCCRNASMVNVANDGFTVGMTYVLEFPAIMQNEEPFVNSSPQLFPPLSDYACIDQLYYTSFAGTDSDGDSLVYSLVAPLNSSSNNAVPIPSPKPHFPVNFVSGFSELNMVPGNPNLKISTDGFLTVKPFFIGVYVFSVLVEEFRAGDKIGQVTRDFQMLVVDGCDPPEPPDAEVRLPGETEFYNEVDTIRFTVGEEKCFEFLVTDDAGEEVNLRAEGVNFTGDVDQIFDFNQGFINDENDTLRIQVCVPECPYVRDIPYIIDLIASDNACPLPQLDTVRLIIDVQPPPNVVPLFQNPPRYKTAVIIERDIYTSKLTATDPDGDVLQGRLEGIDFDPATYGMTLQTTRSEAGELDLEFVWDTDCHKFDFSSKNHFDARVYVDDNDFCSNFDGDTIFYNLNVIFPLNTSPVVTSTSATNNIQIFQGDLLSFDVNATDDDNDNITLQMIGNGFNPNEFGIIFNDNIGMGSITTQFEWDLDCDFLGLTENSSFEFLFVSEDEDECRVINLDTLSIVVDVLVPFNEKPLFDNYSDYELVVNEPFALDIIANDLNQDFLNLDILDGTARPPSQSFNFEKSGAQSSVNSTLEWTPECSLLGEDYEPQNYTVFFLTWDDSCPFVKYDTLAINFLVKELEVQFDNFVPPNAFTPNGDGKNDTYTLTGLISESANLPLDNCEDQFQSIVIVDRSGVQVFKSNDRDFVWTGINVPAGLYYYNIEFLEVSFKSTITILK